MRNLKRVLALAMALVLMLGMMVTASAASYADADQIDADYAEAVAVLTGMGVIQGQTAGFAPKATLTRAEASALIYRILTADVKNEKIDLYDYDSFDDVKEGYWYTGYVTYAANGGYVKGYGNGNFGPDDKVTGVQVLAIMLRALGYGQKGEFEGAGWKDHVLTKANDLGLLNNVKANDLDKEASRELVAQLLFDAIQAPTTTFTPAFDYLIDNGPSLGESKFNLAEATKQDKWGRPYYGWTYKTGEKATWFQEEHVSYYVATTECDIAHDIDMDEAETFTMYTNGIANVTKYNVQPLDTVGTIGAQGTLVEVYDDSNIIVVIDTLLAKVTDVKDATYDKAGHLDDEATLVLEVYDEDTTPVTLTNGDENYTYKKGDMLLINAYMDNTNGAVITGMKQYVEIVDYADALVGAQTFLWYNAKQHTIEGTTYNDAKWLKLDEAGTETTNHTWYFDQYGNVIGATDIATQYGYGIIENIQWINPVGDYGYAQATIRYMDGTTETKVVTAIEGKKTAYAGYWGVGEIQDSAVAVSTNIANNGALCGTDLYRIETDSTGTIALVHVFTDSDKDGVKETGEKNEITAATIKTGISAIQGTANDYKSVIYTNTDTVYLIQTVAGNKVSYTVVTGYENMADYTGTAKVDYVDTDGDIYAELVYVTGKSDSATSTNLFYLTSNNAQAVLKQGVVDYYVVKGYLDGAYREDIKVDPAVITKLIPSVAPAVTTSYVNEMFIVDFDGGVIKTVAGPKTWSDLGAQIGGAYTNQKLAFKAAGAEAEWDGEVLALKDSTGASFKFNVVGLTPVVGEFAANMSNKEIYVIYDTTKTIVDAWVAKAVYVADVAGTPDDSTVSSNWVGNGIDGYWSNTATKQVVAPAGATLAELVTRYTNGTTTATAVYTVAAPDGSVIPVTVTAAANGALKIDDLLAKGATITLVNGAGTWTVID